MPPFFGDFGIAGTAGAGGLSAGAAEAENDTDNPDGEAAEGYGYPELAEGEVKAGKLDIKQVLMPMIFMLPPAFLFHGG